MLPRELHPPAPLAEEENGYAALKRIVADWPAEGVHAPDLKHRRESLPGDREAAERALAPLRKTLDRVPEALAFPRWQVVLPEFGDYAELEPIRRLVLGLLLRHELEGRPDDREAAVEISARLRRSEGPMITFLVGMALGKESQSLDAKLEEDWREAIRWDLARVTFRDVARAALPDEKPEGYPEPPAWEARRLAQAWLSATTPALTIPRRRFASLPTTIPPWSIFPTAPSTLPGRKESNRSC